MQAEDDPELSNERFLEYFRRRALREEGLAGAMSPTGQPSKSCSWILPAIWNLTLLSICSLEDLLKDIWLLFVLDLDKLLDYLKHLLAMNTKSHIGFRVLSMAVFCRGHTTADCNPTNPHWHKAGHHPHTFSITTHRQDCSSSWTEGRLRLAIQRRLLPQSQCPLGVPLILSSQ